jgi:hypothetical protein
LVAPLEPGRGKCRVLSAYKVVLKVVMEPETTEKEIRCCCIVCATTLRKAEEEGSKVSTGYVRDHGVRLVGRKMASASTIKGAATSI